MAGYESLSRQSGGAQDRLLWIQPELRALPRLAGCLRGPGGLAPDLRYLDKAEDGDKWFLNRIRHGYTQNGMTKMPAFEGILSQEAMWAIRTYLDSRYDGD